MKVRASHKVTFTAIEYFLYAVVIIQTAIAAFAYKTVVPQGARPWPTASIYLAVIYFAVLGWVFYQLNRLHGSRKALAAVEADQEAVQAGERLATVIPAVQIPRLFGFTRPQLAIVLLVFVAALKVFGWALANLVKP